MPISQFQLLTSPRADPWGTFLKGQNSHSLGKKMAAKPRPSGQKILCEKALPPPPPQVKKAETVLITQIFDNILIQKGI